MVTITDKAKEKIEELMRDGGMDDSYFLRVSVKGGGCSGHEVHSLSSRYRARLL